MELNNYKKKLKALFERFTQKNYHLKPYYTKALALCFDNCSEKSIEKQLLETAFFSDLVLCALLNVEQIPCTAIKTFLVEIVTVLVKNELQYCKLLYLHGFQTMVAKLSLLSEGATTPAYQLAFTKLPTAQIIHSPGIATIVETKAWIHILRPKTHHKPAPVARSIYSFISQLVWKLNTYEEEHALEELLQYILSPFMNNHQLTTIEVGNEKEKADQVLSFLHAFLAIFDDIPNLMKPSRVMQLLNRTYIVQGHLHFLSQATRDDDVQIILVECIFRFFVASARDKMMAHGKTNSDFLNDVLAAYNNIINFLISQRMVTVLINFTIKCIMYWSKLESVDGISQTFDINGHTFDMRNQLVLLAVVPILTYAAHYSKKDTFVDTFYFKFTAISTEHIVKLYFKYKTLLESTDIKKNCLLALREAFKLKGYLNVAQAGIVYQSLYYALDCHVATDGSGSLIPNRTPLTSVEDTKILSFVFDFMFKLLKEHQINWYDSLEIICYQNTIMNVLHNNILPTKLLIQALNLIDLSIKNFLSPDLSLLVESKNGSTLYEIGKVVRSFMYHEEWEIRDSALQIVLSCTDVAYVKYVPLQKLILQNSLIAEAARIVIDDNEYYVQASAMKCLASAARIESIWREVLLVHPHLYKQLLCIICHNPEGMVRMEAINVLTELYVHQRLPKSFIKCLYSKMTISAIDDLHWEVQLSALNFWKQVIQSLLSDRGMIDGKFPAMTFSKEKRKIITLNNAEITRQLTCIMDSLSSIGCLDVLVECLNEEYNTTVMEQAYAISKDIMSILDYYKYEIPSITDFSSSAMSDQLQNFELNIASDPMGFDSDMMSFDNSDIVDRNVIIDKITSTSDAELIGEMFDNYISIKNDDCIEDSPTQSKRKTITPYDFISNFKQTDYLSKLKNKENWNLSNLDTLLDEIFNLEDENNLLHDECAYL
ncbi:uncharacterized protein LOC135086934 isoform X1 [Ostrinia nubilalis]|uniref:uncharacterized protein LOC135086934 isoform X1 n=1 Tax=Ostrinia nubilalis TaxID=29057 RepID=UPI00308263ED